MSDTSDFLGYLDLIDLLEGLVSTFRYADWQSSYRRDGVPGLVGEFFACLAATNCWTIYIQRDSAWSGVEIEALLFRHGVRVWGRGFIDEEIFFRVKKRQARWAEYLLLRRGVPVTSSSFDPHNREYAKRFAPGDEPPTRPSRSSVNLIDLLRKLFR